jgi:hypothetical protein
MLNGGSRIIVGQTIGFCRLSGCRAYAKARQATEGDGLSHEGHEIFAAVEETELM